MTAVERPLTHCLPALPRLGWKGAMGRRRFDTLAFVTSFKIVMLEGIEVVFIVIAIGASG